MYVVTFKRPGSRKQIESTIGRESKSVTAAYANLMRAKFIGGEQTPEEKRREAKQKAILSQQEAEQKAKEGFSVPSSRRHSAPLATQGVRTHQLAP